jgi:hypothetical protein
MQRSAFVASAAVFSAALPRRSALAQTAGPLKIGALPANVAAAAMFGVLAQRFSVAVREINDWTNKNPGPSAVILSKYTKVPVADIEHMHRGAFPTTFDVGLVQPIIDAAVKYGVLAKSFPATEIIYKP